MPEVLIDADPPPAWLSPAESSPTGSRLDLDRALRALRDQLSETRRDLARHRAYVGPSEARRIKHGRALKRAKRR
jgi:ribosomal protein S21